MACIKNPIIWSMQKHTTGRYLYVISTCTGNNMIGHRIHLTILLLIQFQQGYEIFQIVHTGTLAAQKIFQHFGYHGQFKE